MKSQIIIQDQHSGSTIHNVTRKVRNIKRDGSGREVGNVKIKGNTYIVVRDGNGAFYG